MFEIGTSLREARERRRIDLVEAEQATKVRAKYLRALEDERFDLLPGQTYVKGFLRTYADYLGLEGQLYVDEYNSRHVTGDEEPALRARSNSRRRPPPRVDSRPLILALTAIAVGTALVIAAFKFANDPSKDVNAFQPPPAAPAKHKKATGHRAQPTTTHRAPATSAQIAHVSFTARYGPSWIRVHVGSATGRELFAGTIDAGKSRAFAKRRLYVEIGRPGTSSSTSTGAVRRSRPVRTRRPSW